MRLALITKRFPPACCGVGDYTAQLARTLADRGHEVVVFTATQEAAGASGVRVVTVPLHGGQDLPLLLGALQQEQVDAVQIEYSGYGWGHWGFAFWVNTLVASLRRRGLPVAIAFHEFPLRWAQHPLRAPQIALQWLHILRLAARASHVVTNTQPRIQMLRRLLPWRRRRFHYRPNSSTIPLAPIPSSQRDALRARHGAGAGALVVACFGMFAAAKNYEAVIQAVAQLKGQFPLKLWLLGNSQEARPEYISQLRDLVRQLGMEAHVVWPGLLPATEVSAYLQASDLFVLPQPDGHLTRSSAFMAAAAHGLPVIAVRNAPNQREFAHGREVWLVDRSHPAAIAAALSELAGRKDLRESLGRNLSLLYQKQFDWKDVSLHMDATAPAENTAVARLRPNEPGHRT